jgi:ankyrin repeat protein
MESESRPFEKEEETTITTAQNTPTQLPLEKDMQGKEEEVEMDNATSNMPTSFSQDEDTKPNDTNTNSPFEPINPNVRSGPEGKTALHRTVSNRDIASLHTLLATPKIDKESRCSGGFTSLILAAEIGWIEGVKALCECSGGVDINAKSANGGSALAWATSEGHEDVVRYLLSSEEIDIEGRDNQGMTALAIAAQFNYPAIVKLLLGNSADINTRSTHSKSATHKSFTPAIIATCTDAVEALEVLIARGADLSLRTGHDESILEIAILERSRKAVKILLRKLCGNDYPVESVALEIAMAKGAVEIRGVMKTVEMMYAYTSMYAEVEKRADDEEGAMAQRSYTWIPWVLEKAGDVVKPFTLTKMLHVAFVETDVDLLRVLVDLGCDVNRPAGKGQLPLSIAARLCDVELVRILLDTGADANLGSRNTRDGVRYTPFDDAVLGMTPAGENIEVVKLLLERGCCRVNKGVDIDCTAFSCMVRRAGEEKWDSGVMNDLARQMIDSVIDIDDDRDDTGHTVLHVAVYHKRADLIDLLLARGANIEAMSSRGWTPFILACQHSPSMISVLVEKGANVHAKGEHGIGAHHFAAAMGNLEALELLLEMGLNIEQKTQEGFTPLASSLTRGQENTALALLKHGADLTWTTDRHRTALHLAAYTGLRHATAEILKHPEIDVNAPDRDGWTPLHDACKNGTLAIVSALLDAGADINPALPNGQQALHIALIEDNEEIAILLLDRGASVTSKTTSSRSALHIAASHGLLRATTRLLEAGHPTEVLDGRLWTPLCCANSPAVARELIRYGADVNYKDGEGWTPLHQAVFEGDAEVARVLIEEGADVEVRTTDDGLTVLERADDAVMLGKGTKEMMIGGRELMGWVLERSRRVREEMVTTREENLGKEREMKDLGDEEGLEGLGESFEVVQVKDEEE